MTATIRFPQLEDTEAAQKGHRECGGRCGRTISYDSVACVFCWPSLPTYLAAAVVETDGLPLVNLERMDALVSAREWYAEHPRHRQDQVIAGV